MVHILLFGMFLYIPGGARCCLWKTTPRRNFPRRKFQSHRPRFPNPPGQVRRHISELLTKAKADFREHFGAELGWKPVGTQSSHLPKSMGNPWFEWFGSIDLGGEYDTRSKLQMFGIGNTEELYHVSDILCQ